MDLTSWQSRINGFIQTHSKNVFKCHLIKVHLVGKFKKQQHSPQWPHCLDEGEGEILSALPCWILFDTDKGLLFVLPYIYTNVCQCLTHTFFRPLLLIKPSKWFLMPHASLQ